MRFVSRCTSALGFAILLFLPSFICAQTVAVSPGYVNVGVKGTVQYSAVVTGLNNTSVTWSVSGTAATSGTISPSGLYTAPATVPTNSVLVRATASDQKTYSLVYVNVEPAGPTIKAVSPSSIPVGSYTATLTGSGFQPGATVLAGGVSYDATVINSTTLLFSGYQPSLGTATFQVENPGTLFGAPFSVTFKTNTPQTISPTTITVDLGAKQQFISSSVTSWKASAGTIDGSGLYTAPAAMPPASQATITATGSNGSASAIVTLVPPQTISPTSVSLALGATRQFTSAGATRWTASAGSISATGLYTAPSPATLPPSLNVTITAIGPHESASAQVVLIPPTPVITAVGNGTLPLGIFNATITGSGFTAQSVAYLNGAAVPTVYGGTTLTVSGFYSESGVVNFTVSNDSVTSTAFPVQVGVKNPLASAAASRRFLEQAAFGPTPADAAHVQTIGIPAWITEQFNMPEVSNYNLITSGETGMPNHFLTMAVTNPDQLRQRTALALSEIFVTSFNKLIWNDDMAPFQSMLLADSFTNYRQIMEDVTLSSAMGQYLDMANNAMANPAIGTLANENYARELMQLFTTGDVLLNQDGSPQLDANQLPIPVYSQFTITEFARVYTGWTYAPSAGRSLEWQAWMSTANMVPYPPEHDSGSKQLLNGYVSQAGATPQQDLANALDNIFNHPNVGPFVGRQLIQHLVKSNPSPAYISRVAAAFNNNGNNVRGDMRAVITAVLMDPEARANDEGGKDLPTDGHLVEPAIIVPAMVRAFSGQMTDANYYSYDFTNLGQDIFNAPSVFNYFEPTYVVPGTSLTGGEFQIDSPNNAIVRANEFATLMFSEWNNPLQSYGPGTSVDLSPYVALATNPSTLVAALDLALTHGVMPATMKAQIVAAVNADSGYGSVHQVQTAAYLILSSGYYNVWH